MAPQRPSPGHVRTFPLLPILMACAVAWVGIASPSPAAAADDRLSPEGLLDDLAALPMDGPLAPYLLEAAVANGRDPAHWPSTDEPVLDAVRLPGSDELLPLLRPAHALAVAGTLSPADAERLRAHRDGSGYGSPDTFNDDVYALRTLAAAGMVDQADADVAARIAGLQGDDGGWGWRIGGASETDMTGVVVETLLALDALGPEAAALAQEYLSTAADRDGGYPQRHGGASNCNSTVWSIRGLHALGADVPPAAWEYLAGLRVRDGVAYQEGQGHLPLCTAEVAALVGTVPATASGHDAAAPWALPVLALLLFWRR